MIRFLYILFLGVPLLFLSCKEPTVVVDKVKAKPTAVFESKHVKIPYYEFDEFEKFLDIEDDQIYVINFWATWCVPCVEELPHFESINTTYKHKNVNVILVSLDRPKDVESRLFPFIKKHQIQSEVIMLNDTNPNAWINRVDPNWSGAIPITIIYRNQKRRFYEKTFSLNELKKEVERFF